MFRRYFKIELKRGFQNWYYVLALVVMCVLTSIHFVTQVLPLQPYIIQVNPEKGLGYIYTVFGTWMGSNFTNVYTMVFYMTVPLAASLPFASSYFTDKKDGYIKGLFIKGNKKYYYLAKYMVVFLTAGSICVIPQILNLMLTMTVMPSALPQVGGFYSIFYSSMFADVFYSHPYIYLAIFMIINFCVIGSIATVALIVSFFVNNRYVVMFSPFILFMLMHFLGEFVLGQNWSPYYLIMPFQPYTLNNTGITCTYVAGIFLATFLAFYIGGKKNDTF